MSRYWKWTWGCCRSGARLGFWALNGLLFLAAGIQGWVIWQLVSNKGIEIPKSLIEHLQTPLRDQGLNLAWDRGTLNLDGRLQCRNLVLRHRELHESLVEARLVEIDLNWLSLLLGIGQPVQRLRLDGGTLAVPAPYARTGQHEAIVEDLALDLQFYPERTECRYLQMRVGLHTLSVHGPWTPAATAWVQSLIPSPNAGPEAEHQGDVISKGLKILAGVPRLLEPFGPTQIRLQLDEDQASREVRLALEARIEKWAPLPSLSLEEIHLQIPAFTLQTRATPELSLEVGQAAQGPHRIRHVQLRGLSPQWAAGRLSWVNPWDFSFGPGVFYGERIDFGHFAIAPGTPADAQLSGQIAWRGLSLQGRAGGDWTTGAVVAALTGELDLPGLLGSPAPALAGVASVVQSGAPLTAEATLEFLPGWHWNGAWGRILGERFTVYQSQFGWVEAWAYVNRDKIIAHDIRAQTDRGQGATGMYVQDFRTHDFRILANGTIYPPTINSLLGDWWDRLWIDIVADRAPLQGDVDVICRFGSPEVYQVRVLGHGPASYKGVPVDYVRVQLGIAPGYVAIPDLLAVQGGGQLAGAVDLLFPRDHHQPREQHLREIHSTLPFTTLTGLLGEEGHALQRRFQLTERPDVSFSGQMDFDRHTDALIHRELHLQVATQAPFSYEGIPFDHMRAQVEYGDKRVTINDLNFGLFGGDGQGWILLQDNAEAQPMIDLDLALQGASYNLANKTLQNLSNSKNPTDAKDVEDEPLKGQLALRFTGTGPADDFRKLTGNGQITLTEANLKRLRVLGALSQLFEGLGLGFTTYNLDTLRSDVTVGPEVLTFSQTEVTGKGITIKGRGSYRPDPHNLDFDARVFFIDPDNRPSLGNMIGTMLIPLGQALEVHLTGKPEDPKWSLKVRPFNFLEPDGVKAPALQGTP